MGYIDDNGAYVYEESDVADPGQGFSDLLNLSTQHIPGMVKTLVTNGLAADPTVADAAAAAVGDAVDDLPLAYNVIERRALPTVEQPSVGVEAGTIAYETGRFGQGLAPGGVVRLTNPTALKAALSGSLSMTVEAWVMIPYAQRAGYSGFFGMGAAVIAVNPSGGLIFSPFNASGTAVVADGQWHHLAFTVTFNSSRLGWANLRVYLDGVLDISIATTTQAAASWTDTFYIAGFPGGTNNKLARVDEYRVSRGIRYSGNFTRPTAAFTLDDDTLTLLHLNGNLTPETIAGGYPPRPNAPDGAVRYIGWNLPASRRPLDQWKKRTDA